VAVTVLVTVAAAAATQAKKLNPLSPSHRYRLRLWYGFEASILVEALGMAQVRRLGRRRLMILQSQVQWPPRAGGPPPAPGRAAPDNENFVLKFAQCLTQKQKTASKRLVIKPVLALSLSGISEVYACSGMCHGECVARNYSADCLEVLLPATISSDRGYCSCLLFVRLSGSTSAYEPHWTNRITSAFGTFTLLSFLIDLSPPYYLPDLFFPPCNLTRVFC
jgi:hypothetical protein